MTQNEAMQKAVKLLRLATSSNPHEAALAAGRAQEIIDRFKLGSLSLDYAGASAPEPDEEIKNFGFDPIDAGAHGATWKGRLCLTLAKMNQSICYKGTGGTLCLIGRPSDVTTVRYIYAWLVREVEKLAAKNCAGCGRTFANNYRLGVVETVCDRLKQQASATVQAVKTEAKVEMDNNPLAIVRVEQAIANIEKREQQVRDWQLKNFKLGKSSGGRTRFDSTAREQGRRDGHSVSIRPSSGNLTGGNRQLSNA